MENRLTAVRGKGLGEKGERIKQNKTKLIDIDNSMVITKGIGGEVR